jgi:hypothetical protein
MTNINSNGITNNSIAASEIDWNKNISSGIKITDANLVIENGDVLIDNYSLLQVLKNIEERLALLTPNPELENDWKELKNLGNQYRELEKKILEKEKTWDILKK